MQRPFVCRMSSSATTAQVPGPPLPPPADHLSLLCSRQAVWRQLTGQQLGGPLRRSPLSGPLDSAECGRYRRCHAPAGPPLPQPAALGHRPYREQRIRQLRVRCWTCCAGSRLQAAGQPEPVQVLQLQRHGAGRADPARQAAHEPGDAQLPTGGICCCCHCCCSCVACLIVDNTKLHVVPMPVLRCQCLLSSTACLH